MFTIPFNVQRTIAVSKPVEDIFQIIADFNSWRSWSPWLCQEPECPVSIQGQPGKQGHSQRWDGERIGTGEMMLMAVDSHNGLRYQITFLKPWKSQAKVNFEFTQAGECTKITWSMQGTLPIFMIFMRNAMSALVASDYERGLVMLKELAETGEVLSHTKVLGELACDGFYYLGRRKTCELNEVALSMENDFVELNALLEKQKIPSPDFSVSLYHQYDLAKQQCVYTSGFGYVSKPLEMINDDFESGCIEHHKALCVDHVGAYRHLGNGWSTAHGLLRVSKQKASKKIPMYEIYANSPGDVDEGEC